jgi:hypothetical protein
VKSPTRTWIALALLATGSAAEPAIDAFPAWHYDTGG